MHAFFCQITIRELILKVNCPALSEQQHLFRISPTVKNIHLFPVFLFPYCRAWCSLDVPSVYPHTALSLKGRWLNLCRASFTLSAPVLLSLARYTTTLLCFFFTFISSVSSPNSTRPLFAFFPFFSLSLFLRTPHYALSAFLILSPISHCLSPLISLF